MLSSTYHRLYLAVCLCQPVEPEQRVSFFLFFKNVAASPLKVVSHPKCKPCKLSLSGVCCGCVFCLVELIALALPAKQVAILVSFWLHFMWLWTEMTASPFHPGAWPGLDAPRVLLSVSHWSFGPTLIVLSVLVCDREGREAERHSVLWCLARELEGQDYSQEAREMTAAANFGKWHIRTDKSTDIAHDVGIQLLPRSHTHTSKNPILIQANASYIKPPPGKKCLILLFPTHTWDLNALSQSGAVRFDHPTDPGFIWSALVRWISGCGPMFCPWAGMLLGIRMCQIKCCGYLSHNCYESGNTLFLELG